MDLDFTEEHDLLRGAVRELCAAHATPEIVRAMEDDPRGFRDETWSELAKMDLLGLLVPEELGGSAQGTLEVAIVAEELGRALLPSPYVFTAVIGARLLLAGGSETRRREWLPKIARGEAILAPAWLEPAGGFGPEGVRAEARAGAITGEKILVPFASAAARLLVLARDGDDIGVWLVDPNGRGVALTHTKTMASDACYRASFDGAPGERIASWAEWEQVAVDAWIALAALAAGGAARAHEMAVGYAKERVQFGKPIGAFQGIAHPLAEMAMEVEGARALVWQAAWARDHGKPGAETLAAMAKLYAADVFRRTTKVGQQTFGGIGFTRNIDMQLYYRRAKQLEIAWWDPRFLEELVAASELDSGTPFLQVDVADRV